VVWLWITLGVAAVWALVVTINRWFVRRVHGLGDPGQGIVVFVEPVRWLFIIWGVAPIGWGLRRAGWGGRLTLFRWGSALGSLFVLPDLMRHKWLLRQAERLAEHIAELAHTHPDRPIHLLGCSNGCYLCVEAAKRVQPGLIDRIVLMGGVISPTYDLEPLASRVVGVHNFHSPLDIISVLATLLFGSSDRRWGLGSGTVGFADSPVLTQHAWGWRDVRHGHLGDHFTMASPWFATHAIAPIIHSVREREDKPRRHKDTTADTTVG
jgi:hypothetical protein